MALSQQSRKLFLIAVGLVVALGIFAAIYIPLKIDDDDYMSTDEAPDVIVVQQPALANSSPCIQLAPSKPSSVRILED